MSHYDNLDALILQAIGRGASQPLYVGDVDSEARLIAEAMGRDAFRVIDGRLTALKKAGHIVHRSKKEAKKSGMPKGWSAT